jgi:hypothetical protein
MVSSASSSALVLCLAWLFAPQLHGVAGEDGDGEGRGDVGANRWDDSDKHYQEFIRRGTRCMSFLSICASFSPPFLPVPPPSPHSFLACILVSSLPHRLPPVLPPPPSLPTPLCFVLVSFPFIPSLPPASSPFPSFLSFGCEFNNPALAIWCHLGAQCTARLLQYGVTLVHSTA